MIEESLEPVVRSTATSTEAITNEFIPIKEQLEQLTKLVKPKVVKIDIKRPAEEQPEQFEVNQPIKKQSVEFGPLAKDFLKDYMDAKKRHRKIDSSFGFRHADSEWKIG